MKLTEVKINYRAFGMSKTDVIEKPSDYTINQAQRYIKNKLHCETAIVYSIEINGQIILNEKHEAFEIIGKQSEKVCPVCEGCGFYDHWNIFTEQHCERDCAECNGTGKISLINKNYENQKSKK